MRVLVTRPTPAAEKTAAKLARRGHQAVLLPLMQAEHRLDALSKAPPADTVALAATSAEAIRALASLSQTDRLAYLALPLFAVGQATAAAASALGFSRVETGTGDGEALARHMLVSLRTRPGERILYLAGQPRTSDFERLLTDASRLVDLRECYRMVPIEWNCDSLARHLEPMPDAILLYSSEAARRFSVLAPSAGARNARFFCLSHKIAATLPEEFQAHAHWPMEPREDFLLDLLEAPQS